MMRAVVSVENLSQLTMMVLHTMSFINDHVLPTELSDKEWMDAKSKVTCTNYHHQKMSHFVGPKINISRT